MNNCLRLWSVGLGLLAAGPAFGAEPLPWPDEAAPAETVLQKSSQLIREKAALPVSPSNPNAITIGMTAKDLPPPPGDVLQLDPVIVHGQAPTLIPPAVHETPATKFFRTGAIWQGKRFKLWMAGDKGLMLSFSW